MCGEELYDLLAEDEPEHKSAVPVPEGEQNGDSSASASPSTSAHRAASPSPPLQVEVADTRRRAFVRNATQLRIREFEEMMVRFVCRVFFLSWSWPTDCALFGGGVPADVLGRRAAEASSPRPVASVVPCDTHAGVEVTSACAAISWCAVDCRLGQPGDTAG